MLSLIFLSLFTTLLIKRISHHLKHPLSTAADSIEQNVKTNLAEAESTLLLDR